MGTQIQINSFSSLLLTTWNNKSIFLFFLKWGDGSIKWGSEEWKILKELQPFISVSA